MSPYAAIASNTSAGAPSMRAEKIWAAVAVWKPSELSTTTEPLMMRWMVAWRAVMPGSTCTGNVHSRG